jgi:hypothetical protein
MPHAQKLWRIRDREKVSIDIYQYHFGTINVLIKGAIPQWILKYPQYITLSEKHTTAFVFGN